MGWFSDALFGERKRIDQSKLDDYMAPTRGLIDQQTDIANQMMDPNSDMNRRNLRMQMGKYYDTLDAQNQNLFSTAAMRGVSPGQTAMMQGASNNTARGQFGDIWGNQMNNMYGQGLGLLQSVTGLEQGMNAQRANTYIQQINASNQRRAGNMGFASSMLGGLMGGMGRGINSAMTGEGTGATNNIKEFLQGVVGYSPPTTGE